MGLALTASKVLPKYKPNNPRIEIITPDKNQIDTIKLL